jgi:hypothetical protein
VRPIRALLLAVLLAAAQGSAWLHASVVSHVTCLEHGESIHAAEGRTPGLAAGSRVEAPSLSADPVAAAGHDHCAGGALLRWRDVAIDAPTGAVPLPPVAPPPAPPPAPAAASCAVAYVVAPKTSPPRSVV